MAQQTARTLPVTVGAKLIRAADHAFVSAITRGFMASTIVVGLAVVVAVTMVLRRMRAGQFEAEHLVDADAQHAVSEIDLDLT